MKRQLSTIALLLSFAALISVMGMSAMQAQALSDGEPRGFAESIPSIPGFNAPYPVQARASYSFAASVPAIPGYTAAYPQTADLYRPAAGSFAATAPRIPGMTVLSEAAPAGAASIELRGFSAAAPLIPGYTAQYPVEQGTVASRD